MSDKNQLFDWLKELETDRKVWETTWQNVAEYVHTRKDEFLRKRPIEGELLNDDLNDNTALLANHTRASTLLSLLWNNGSFKLVPSNKKIKNNKSIIEWFQENTNILIEEMNNSESGLDLSLNECEQNDGAFGTSTLLAFEGDGFEEPLLKFQSWDLMETFIDENAQGKVDVIFRKFKWNVRKVVDKYGIKNVSERTRDLFNKGDLNKKIDLINAIFPRKKRRLDRDGNLDMPFASLHYEKDDEFLLLETGFRELPFFVVRENKKTNERYGRGPGVNAINDVFLVNKIMEDIFIGVEKSVNPPLVLIDESGLGNAEIDDSPRGVSVLRVSGRLGIQKPLFPLTETTGELKTGAELAQSLRDSINKHFSLDRLLDFNNQTEMTATEVQARAVLRQQSLGSIFDIKVIERYTPLIRRCFNILLRKGLFGFAEDDPRFIELVQQGIEPKVIPSEILELIDKNEDIYKIEYLTPAARDKKIIEAQSYIKVWEVAGLLAEISGNMEVMDNLDPDETIRLVGELSFSNEIFRKAREVKAIRDQRQQQTEASVALEAGEAISKIKKNNKEAENK